MLNRNLIGGGNNLSKDYTHIVTVGEHGVDFYSYGYNSNFDYGSISPSVMFPNTPVRPNPSIIYLYVPGNQIVGLEQTHFMFDGSSYTFYPTLYIARSDTNYVDYKNSVEANNDISFSGNIFSYKDVGKQVKIWISTAPPLGTTRVIKGKSVSSNCHLYREVA